MAVLVVVLVLALAGVGGRVWMVNGSAKQEVAGLQAEKVTRAKAKSDAEKKAQDDFDKADLPGKLQKVKDLTTAAGRALTDWGTRGAKVSEIKTVRQARNKCDEAVLDYNAAAAPFSAQLLAELPKTIDLTDKETDCGR